MYDLMKCNICFIVFFLYCEEQTLPCSHQEPMFFRVNEQEIFKPSYCNTFR